MKPIVHEHNSFSVTLASRHKEPGDKQDDAVWKDEALISGSDFQPLIITTRLSRRIPLFVPTVLGTNLEGLGFNLDV